MSRNILAQPTLDDALAFICNVPHALASNYVIGGPERIVSYECSANQVSQFIPYKGATRVYHTNHPLVNDDVVMTAEAFAQLPPDGQELVRRNRLNTEARFRCLESRLRDASKPVTVETAQAILCSHDPPEHPICNHKRPESPAMTVAGLIMLLSDSPEFSNSRFDRLPPSIPPKGRKVGQFSPRWGGAIGGATGSYR